MICFLEFIRVVPSGQLFCIFSAESENAERNWRCLVACVATRLDLQSDVKTSEKANSAAVQKKILDIWSGNDSHLNLLRWQRADDLWACTNMWDLRSWTHWKLSVNQTNQTTYQLFSIVFSAFLTVASNTFGAAQGCLRGLCKYPVRHYFLVFHSSFSWLRRSSWIQAELQGLILGY